MGAPVRAATILAKGRAKPVNALVKRHGEDAPIQAAIRADAMLDRWDVEGVYEGSFFRDSHPSSRIGTRCKAKPKKKTRAPRKAAVPFNEAALTKGELRKLNALKKSVGDKITDQPNSLSISSCETASSGNCGP